MSESNIDRDHLRITGRHKAITDTHFEVRGDSDGVIVIVTQAFGPDGDNLVGVSDVTFDGLPAVTVTVEANGQRGDVHLSPIHGDDRKAGFTDIPSGTKCKLFCPVSGKPLDVIGDVEDSSHGAKYYALYLTSKLSNGSMVAISDVWGHYHSRIIDDFELISHWHNHEELAASSNA